MARKGGGIGAKLVDGNLLGGHRLKKGRELEHARVFKKEKQNGASGKDFKRYLLRALGGGRIQSDRGTGKRLGVEDPAGVMSRTVLTRRGVWEKKTLALVKPRDGERLSKSFLDIGVKEESRKNDFPSFQSGRVTESRTQDPERGNLGARPTIKKIDTARIERSNSRISGSDSLGQTSFQTERETLSYAIDSGRLLHFALSDSFEFPFRAPGCSRNSATI